MKTHFNEAESEKFNNLMKLVSEYEKTVKNKDEIFGKIQLICPEMDRDFLEDYWKSQSIDEFCSIHSVQNAVPVTEAESNSILEDIVRCASEENYDNLEYLVEKYSNYYEIKFGCPTGTFRDVAYDESNKTIDAIISALRKNGPIRL